jgi:hypothetical protein
VDNKTRSTTLCLDLVHAAALNRGRVLPRLLDFEEQSPALLDAQEVGTPASWYGPPWIFMTHQPRCLARRTIAATMLDSRGIPLPSPMLCRQSSGDTIRIPEQSNRSG